jgi:hypothetical protein
MTDDGFDPQDEQIASYLRSRGNVPVPADLMQGAIRRAQPQPPTVVWQRPRALFGGLAAALALVVVAVIVVVNLPNPAVVVSSASPSPSELASATPEPSGSSPLPSASSSSPAPTPTATRSAEPTGPTPMPTTVMGMPVLTVAQASQLLDNGELNGRAVAVSGYFYSASGLGVIPPGGPLVNPAPSYFVAFTDSPVDAVLCHSKGNETSCRFTPDGVPYLTPFFMTETNALSAISEYQPRGQPVNIVAIGHAGDARLLQCLPPNEAECANAFVVDRVVWVAGHDIPVAAADPYLDPPIAPAKMTLTQVVADIGLGDEVLTAVPIDAARVSTIDPRWNFVGDNIVWVVRSLQPDQSMSGPTRSETVWLVDDSTGKLLGSHDLALPSIYPPRLWIEGTTHGLTNCFYEPFYRIEAGATVLSGASVAGGGCRGGTGDATMFDPRLPVVLDPGTYSVSAWLAHEAADGTTGPSMDGCSTEVTLTAGDNVMLAADFPVHQACTFGPLSPYSAPKN